MSEDFLLNYRIDLQLFANPEDEGRTENPTERKKREKREEGQVAKSQELVSAGTFLVSFAVFALFFEYFVRGVFHLMRHYLGHLEHDVLLGGFSEALLLNIYFWKSLLPVFLAAVLAAVTMNIIQVGFLIAPKSIEPKFSRVTFTFEKFRERIFFSRVAMWNLIFTLGRIFFLIAIFLIFIYFHLHELLNITTMGLKPAISFLLSTAVKIFLFSGFFLILIGIPDFFTKRKHFQDSLKITRSEAKRELKQEDGDPRMKSQMREMFNKLLQKQNARQRVPDADVVITNPTHFAIALKYEMDAMEFPMVLAKGEDEMALLIREIAKERGIEIVENPPLARELYKLVNVGDYIPEHLTFVIAEIFIGLYKKGKWSMEGMSEEETI